MIVAKARSAQGYRDRVGAGMTKPRYTDGRREILTLNGKCAANPKELFRTGDHMSEKIDQDTEKSEQAAGPFIWILGLVGITLLGLAVAGGV